MYTLYGNYTRTCIINIVMHVQTYLWRTSTNRDLRRVRAEGVSRSKTTDGSFVSSGDCWLNIRALALSYSSSRSSKLLNDFRPERSEEEPRIVSSYCIYNVHVIRVRHMLTSCICTQCKYFYQIKSVVQVIGTQAMQHQVNQGTVTVCIHFKGSIIIMHVLTSATSFLFRICLGSEDSDSSWAFTVHSPKRRCGLNNFFSIMKLVIYIYTYVRMTYVHVSKTNNTKHIWDSQSCVGSLVYNNTHLVHWVNIVLQTKICCYSVSQNTIKWRLISTTILLILL